MHIVHTESSLGWGGQEIRILTEATGMLGRGHRVTLLAPASAPIYSEAKRRGLEVTALAIEKKRFSGLLATIHWLNQNPTVDVINTHSSTDSWLFGIAMTFTAKKIAIVRTRHISAPVTNKATNRWLYGRSAQRVVTTGESLRHELAEKLRLPSDHFISIATGIDLKKFSKEGTLPREEARLCLGLPANAFVIGIAATLRSWKGHDDLLTAFDSLCQQHPSLHLVIAGDGPRREYLTEKISKLPSANRVHLIGHRDDVPAILAALDIFVLPSYANEGVPQAIMQAMAMSLPVVSTTIGAISDAVTDGVTGYLLPPKQPEELARAINELKDSPSKREAMAKEGRKTAERKFSLDGMLDAMEKVFQDAILKTRS